MDLGGNLCSGRGLLFATLAAFGGLALATLTLACGAVVGAVRTALSRPAAVTLVAGRRLELVVGTSVSAGLASRCAGAAATARAWTPSGGKTRAPLTASRNSVPGRKAGTSVY
ncbi:MAG: hypothetical protein WCC65_01270 [Pseudonocardiaceae bacterium]